MNDPHVQELQYKVVHEPRYDYSSAAPVTWSSPDFDVVVEDDRVTFKMKTHFDDVGSAIECVRPTIQRWRLAAALKYATYGAFDLAYVSAGVIDRNPPPTSGGTVIGSGSLQATGTITISGSATLTARMAAYPTPPDVAYLANDDVTSLVDRYVQMTAGRESLAAAAYFCLDVLEHDSRGTRLSRADAAKHLNVHFDVLSEMGRLTSTAGGTGARKAEGRASPYTTDEIKWLKRAMPALIERLWDIDAGKSGLLQLNVADI